MFGYGMVARGAMNAGFFSTLFLLQWKNLVFFSSCTKWERVKVEKIAGKRKPDPTYTPDRWVCERDRKSAMRWNIKKLLREEIFLRFFPNENPYHLHYLRQNSQPKRNPTMNTKGGKGHDEKKYIKNYIMSSFFSAAHFGVAYETGEDDERPDMFMKTVVSPPLTLLMRMWNEKCRFGGECKFYLFTFRFLCYFCFNQHFYVTRKG